MRLGTNCNNCNTELKPLQTAYEVGIYLFCPACVREVSIPSPLKVNDERVKDR
jgi:hypothetical protein